MKIQVNWNSTAKIQLNENSTDENSAERKFNWQKNQLNRTINSTETNISWKIIIEIQLYEYRWMEIRLKLYGKKINKAEWKISASRKPMKFGNTFVLLNLSTTHATNLSQRQLLNNYSSKSIWLTWLTPTVLKVLDSFECFLESHVDSRWWNW